MNDSRHTIFSVGGNQENGSCCETELKLEPYVASLRSVSSPCPKRYSYICILKSQFSNSSVTFF